MIESTRYLTTTSIGALTNQHELEEELEKGSKLLTYQRFQKVLKVFYTLARIKNYLNESVAEKFIMKSGVYHNIRTMILALDHSTLAPLPFFIHFLIPTQCAAFI